MWVNTLFGTYQHMIVVMRLSLQVDTQCTGKVANNISVKLNNTDTFNATHLPTCPLQMSIVDCESWIFTFRNKSLLSISVNLTPYLETKSRYTAAVVLGNAAGETESSKVNFSECSTIKNTSSSIKKVLYILCNQYPCRYISCAKHHHDQIERSHLCDLQFCPGVHSFWLSHTLHGCNAWWQRGQGNWCHQNTPRFFNI